MWLVAVCSRSLISKIIENDISTQDEASELRNHFILLEKILCEQMFSKFSPSVGDVPHVASRNMCFSAHGPHDWSQRPFGQSFSRMTHSQSSHTAVL